MKRSFWLAVVVMVASVSRHGPSRTTSPGSGQRYSGSRRSSASCSSGSTISRRSRG